MIVPWAFRVGRVYGRNPRKFGTSAAERLQSPGERTLRIMPRCSMYGIFTYRCLKYMVNVDRYSIHGASVFVHLPWLYTLFLISPSICKVKPPFRMILIHKNPAAVEMLFSRTRTYPTFFLNRRIIFQAIPIRRGYVNIRKHSYPSLPFAGSCDLTVFFHDITHLKFNIAFEKLPSQKERIVFQPSFCRCELLNFGGVPSLHWVSNHSLPLNIGELKDFPFDEAYDGLRPHSYIDSIFFGGGLGNFASSWC